MTNTPPFNPDNDLMADIEGNRRAVKAYRSEADSLRDPEFRGDDPVFGINYWVVSRALNRAFEDERDSGAFWRAVAELSAVYPQFDWRNTMTD